jgi:hypothetical protein
MIERRTRKRMYIQKKAVDLTDLAVGIIVLAIVVSIGAFVLQTYRNSQATSLPVVSTVNETITGLTDAGDVFANQWFISLTHCLNATTPYSAVPTTNYTTTVSAVGQGTIYARAGQYNQTDILCTYTRYNVSDVRFNIANDAVIGLGEYGNWFKIIVIVGVAAVVLALIFSAFGRGDSSAESGGSY